MKYIIFACFFVCFACATSPRPKSPHDSVTKKSVSKYIEKKIELSANTGEKSIYNGHLKYVEFIVDGIHDFQLVCNGNNIAHSKKYPDQNIYFSYLAQSYFIEKTAINCFIHYVEQKNHKQEKLVVLAPKVFAYKEEHLENVSKKHVVVSAANQQRAAKEAAMLQQIYSKSDPRPLYHKPFIAPLESFRTSIYGNRRVMNKVKKTQHLGNDFRAAVGTPIPSSNTGRVVFTGDLFYTGNTIIIDHGIGLFSMYAHLNHFKVEAGDMVEQGEIIALSGATGRVSGPHLHWGVKVQGHWVDGFSLIHESQKQFKSLQP